VRELFGRKEKTISEKSYKGKSEEETLKEMLEEEVENLQKNFRIKINEVKENEQKLNAVKEEYDSTVTNLMELKKEVNQKILELDVVKREYKDIRQKIEEAGKNEQKNKVIVNEIEKNEINLKNIKQELEKLAKKESEIKDRISEAQSKLQEVKLQQTQNQNKLAETTSHLNNQKQDSGGLDKTFIFSDKEKEFIKDQIGPDQYTKGIIEAASVVTASLKSKLNLSQKELETVQKLLERERKEHMLTKETLEKFQDKESKKKL